jgi:hypothetical protein
LVAVPHELLSALLDVLGGHLSVRTYIKFLENTRIESVFCKEDPLPSLGEIALFSYLAIKKYL